MSSGYASRLKEYPNKGECGLPELKETTRCFQAKRKQLADMVKASRHVVILTGAGISTSSGIPDFRGPNGIWTQEKQKQKSNNKATKTSSGSRTAAAAAAGEPKKRKRQDEAEDSSNVEGTTNPPPPPPPSSQDFSHAQPTLTHRAIAFLVEKKVVNFCITQNVDGLHQRSGLSRSKLAVLHGCVFTERCEDCGTEHFGDQDVGGMSFQRTGRKCQAKNCQGHLRDTLLDWKDPLPVDDLERSEKECDKADLVLCLGTSLRIEPAASLPGRAMNFVIVNLQVTPYDDQASLIIRAKVDVIMENLLCDLGFPNWQAEWTPRPVERLWNQGGKRASTWWEKVDSDSDSEDQDETNLDGSDGESQKKVAAVCSKVSTKNNNNKNDSNGPDGSDSSDGESQKKVAAVSSKRAGASQKKVSINKNKRKIANKRRSSLSSYADEDEDEEELLEFQKGLAERKIQEFAERKRQHAELVEQKNQELLEEKRHHGEMEATLEWDRKQKELTYKISLFDQFNKMKKEMGMSERDIVKLFPEMKAFMSTNESSDDE